MHIVRTVYLYLFDRNYLYQGTVILTGEWKVMNNNEHYFRNYDNTNIWYETSATDSKGFQFEFIKTENNQVFLLGENNFFKNCFQIIDLFCFDFKIRVVTTA